MSSDSHATITYTSMSSYEVIVIGYFRLPMDPLDPYVQLVMEAPPLPDYIPGPEAPPSPDYIPGPMAPPSPDYIPGPEYPEYLPSADDMLPAEEQPLPVAVLPIAESPGYITESEPEMEPEEKDVDDEEYEEDSIDYPTSRGDDDADDDGDDLSEDDADDEDEEESLDSEEEEEEYLALTVPAPALYSSVSTSEETKPFEEGETAATPPPFGYRVAAKISVQPHILMTFRSDESIPEVDISLRKRARFTTPTGGYEVGESSVAVAARQIRHALTVAYRRRADDRLIGRLRRERRYFRTLSTTYALEIEALQRDVSTLQGQQIDDEDKLTRHIQHEHAQRDVTPEDARTTRANPDPTRTTTATEPMTQEAITNLIAQRVAEALAEYETQRNSVVNGDTSNTTRTGPRTVRPTQECTYKDYLNCGPLKFNSTEGVIGLTRWFERTESVSSMSNCTAKNQVKFGSCTLIGIALTWWNSHMRAVSQEVAYTVPWWTLKQMMTAKYCPRGERMFPEESVEIERYVGGLPEMIRGNVMSYEPKSMQKAIESVNDQMDQKLLRISDRQADNKRSGENHPEEPNLCALNATSTMMDHVGNRNQRNQNQAGNGNAMARAYGLGTAGGNPNANVVTGTFLLNNHCALILFDTGADKSFVSTALSSLININPSTLDHSYDVELAMDK
uniref:Reverse transcriptase domain-containing protein n=1 Tax=Tanacetum cinerariifolium TaxID=118510 RepID=A0A699IYZ6_TANCI|nr:hypothetical protein [Tanacetum cinerariifolium]